MKKRVLFIRDIGFEDDAESERRRAASFLDAYLEVEADFLAEGEDGMPPPVTALNEVRPEIVLVDYGGMSVMGAHDGAKSNVRYVLNWAREHESVAVIIFTMFTQYIVDEILDDLGTGVPDNVFVYSLKPREGKHPGLDSWDEARMRAWVGSPPAILD